METNVRVRRKACACNVFFLTINVCYWSLDFLRFVLVRTLGAVCVLSVPSGLF